MAIVLQAQRKLGEAMSMFEEAMQIAKSNFGSEHPSVAKTLYNMAIVADKRQQQETAKDLILQSHAIFRVAGLVDQIVNSVADFTTQYGYDHELTVFARKAASWVQESD